MKITSHSHPELRKFVIDIEIDYTEVSDSSRYNLIKTMSKAFTDELKKRLVIENTIDRYAGAREVKEAPIRLIKLDD